MSKTFFSFHWLLRTLLAGFIANQPVLDAQAVNIGGVSRQHSAHLQVRFPLNAGAIGPRGNIARVSTAAAVSLPVSVGPSKPINAKVARRGESGRRRIQAGRIDDRSGSINLFGTLPSKAGRKSPVLLSTARTQTTFIENRGQWNEQVRFQMVSGGKRAWLTSTGITFDTLRAKRTSQSGSRTDGPEAGSAPPSLAGANPMDLLHGAQAPSPESSNFERLVFSEDFIGANHNPTAEAISPQPGIRNYLIGNDPTKWHTDIHGYGGVIYRNIWSGIDFKVTGSKANIEQEFVVHPGADLSRVQVAYQGIDKLEIAKDGSLLIRTANGVLKESKPRIYQQIAGKRVAMQGRFKLTSETAYTFEVGRTNSEYALVIDPTLLYSTYLGGTGVEEGKGIAVDSAGNAYVVGLTTSCADFPTTPGALQTIEPNCSGFSTFVTKLSPLGNPLVYSTFLGGGSRAYAIAVDSAGEAYVTGGYAGSDIPTTTNAFQRDCNDSLFLTKLNAQGNGVVYSTCLGHGLAGISNGTSQQSAPLSVTSVLAGKDLRRSEAAHLPEEDFWTTSSESA